MSGAAQLVRWKDTGGQEHIISKPPKDQKEFEELQKKQAEMFGFSLNSKQKKTEISGINLSELASFLAKSKKGKISKAKKSRRSRRPRRRPKGSVRQAEALATHILFKMDTHQEAKKKLLLDGKLATIGGLRSTREAVEDQGECRARTPRIKIATGIPRCTRRSQRSTANHARRRPIRGAPPRRRRRRPSCRSRRRSGTGIGATRTPMATVSVRLAVLRLHSFRQRQKISASPSSS